MSPFGDPVYYGKIYGTFFDNLAIGQVARIDFVYRGKCVVPNGTILNIPGQAVNNIHVRCDGPAKVRYSINAENINENFGEVLAPTIAREVKTPDTIIKSVNLVGYAYGDQLFTAVSVAVLV